MMVPDDISVIICVYTEDRWADLVAAIESVRQQSAPLREIIVVVDHNPALLEQVRMQLVGVRAVENRQSPGLSGARNSGLAVAQGEIIAFMDEDAVAAPDWLAQLSAGYRHPPVSGVGGSIEPIWFDGRPAWFPEEFNWVVGCTYRGMPQAVAPVRNLIGCNMSFRRRVFERNGEFQNGLGRIGARPLGCEETEFCIRASQSLAEDVFLYQPRARVYHRVPASRACWRYFCRRCYAEGHSKAQVSHLVGAWQSLATEWRYTVQTLPQGLLRGIADPFFRHDLAGLGRAGAILAGLTLTTAGFVAATGSAWFTMIRQEMMNVVQVKKTSSFFKETFYSASQTPDFELIQTPEIDSVQSLPAVTSKVEPEGDPFPAEAPFVSMIVATRDRTASLAACLDSLLTLDYPNNYEIIVVDNAPRTSATANFIRQTYGDSARVRYVREERPGLAVAHNRGLLEVKAPLVAFTDDDVRVDRLWLTELVKAFAVAENVACVTGMIYPAELETQAQRWFEQYGGFNKGLIRRIFDLAENRPKNPLYPYTAGIFGSGANMAFKTAVLREIGGFDPALGTGTATLGGDDLAVFFEIIIRGYKLVYEPAAMAYHRHRREYAGLRRQIYGYGVGLTAYLTKCLLDRPELLLDFAVRVPYGLVYLFSPHSPKNRKKSAGYPAELTWIERWGMVYGPLAYLRSRRQTHRRDQQPGLPRSPAIKALLPGSTVGEVPQP
jgi:GT2 family glycosyltransferase